MKYAKPKTKPRKAKKSGGVTKVEKAIVAAVVGEAKSEMSPKEITALATTLNRRPETVKALINEARENLQKDAIFYVEAHKSATVGALATNDFDVARKAAAWAITNISGEGKRIVDKPDSGGSVGVQVMVGVRLGNVSSQPDVSIQTVDGDVIDTSHT